jgi:hypothetical protein
MCKDVGGRRNAKVVENAEEKIQQIRAAAGKADRNRVIPYFSATRAFFLLHYHSSEYSTLFQLPSAFVSLSTSISYHIPPLLLVFQVPE